MSFKYIAEKVGPAHYVLPKVGDMKVEVNAFLSEELYDASEEHVWSQAATGASFEGVIAASLLPDCHFGFGVPVGFALTTTDTLVQCGSGYDISCFTPDTKVPLLDGRVLTFAELVEQYGDGSYFYVYSITPEGRIVSGKAHHPRVTKRNAPLVEVLLDNAASVRCTPDHMWLLRDGTYCKAGDLQEGMSLMPLYRSSDEGYCSVQHPVDNSIERMYHISFREEHGYKPVWPRVIHHDMFKEGNPNPSKTNDDPQYLLEMDQKEHFKLHSVTAKERLARGEIWGAKAHKLYPEFYSKMGSENMTRLHADPDFRERHAKRMSETNRKVRARGGYAKADALAGQRGRTYLLEYNQSAAGRAKSAEVGRRNKGRVMSEAGRKNMSEGHKIANAIIHICPHCTKACKGKRALSRHITLKHNNHKVLSVRRLLETSDVCCMTVDKWSNFALDAGVFVHNCGILICKTNLHARDVQSKESRRKWIQAVEQRVAMGLGRPAHVRRYSQKKVDEILRYGAKALGIHSKVCERQYIPIPEGVDLTSIGKAYSKAAPQLGSLGAGNHFYDLQIDSQDGSVWIMVHSGSRGYGWQTAEHFYFAGAALRCLPSNRREDSWLRMDEPLGKQYWAHHNSAANYALANRLVMVEGLREATQEVFKSDIEVFYDISHNLIQEETLPNGQKGLVHRKGATRAFPAGHPDLAGTAWEKTGHPCLIPGSMYDGAAILFPLEGSAKTGYSVNHGSGRILARGKAKRGLADQQGAINTEMDKVVRVFDGVPVEGIMSNARDIPLDECGKVYKNLDVVLDVLKDEGVARVERRLYPVANLKGLD